MRNINSDDLRLNYSNLFSLNKNSNIDVLESGASATIGFEFTNLDYENNITGSENYSLFLGGFMQLLFNK